MPKRVPKRIGVTFCSTLTLLFCMACLTSTAHADDSSNGITVTGSAKVTGKPNAVQIGAFVSGDAELTADAVVKYRDARKRAIAALQGLKIASLSIESDGFSVKDWVDAAAQQQAMARGQQATNTKQKVSVGEQLRLVIKDADKMDQAALMDTMLKVLDTAKDAGLTIGDASGATNNNDNNNQPSTDSLIKFKVTDCTALRQQAYKQAMDDAKAKAQRLADLAGVKIGKILSVQDGDNSSDSNNGQQSTPQTSNELTSSVFGDIPLTVDVTVQYEIQK